MRPAGVVLGVCALLAAAPPAHAQRPAVGRALDRLAGTDTTLTTWLFVRRSAPLDAVTAFVTGRGGRVRRVSRWLHAVSADLPSAAVNAARTRTDLRRLQLVRRFRRVTPPELPMQAAGLLFQQDSAYGPSAMPLRRLNAFPLVDLGFRGAGVRIALFDTGFETGLPAFAGANVAAQFDFVFNDSIVRDEPADFQGASVHGTTVWSLLAADVADTLIGLAPDATYLLAKTEDVRSETRLEEDNYVAALEWADSIGVDIVSSSIGYTTFDDQTGYAAADYDGDIAVTTVAVDMAAERGILVITAAGNQGGGTTTLITPADADSAIAVGAEDSLGAVAVFSSRGPTADGRIKPDLSAPGVAVWVAAPDGAGGTAFTRVNGTSYATPLVAGAAALFREVHPTFDPIAVRDALRAASDNAATPDNARGWGRPDLHRAAAFPRGITLAPPGPAVLETVTPTFAWSAPDAAPFAQPVTYRLRLGTDTTFATIVLDTTLLDTMVVLPEALAPGATLGVEVFATSADSVTVRAGLDTVFVAPEWVVLQTLDDPGGTTIRDFRPTLEWSVPGVTSPPGPFLFDVVIIRTVDGQIELSADSLAGTTYEPPRDLDRNTPYRWRVTARLGTDSVVVTSRGTFVIVDDTAPPVTALFQNFPNPFPNASIGQSATCLWFDLAVEGVVRLDILDLRGHIARTLFPQIGDVPFLRPGRYGRPSEFDGARCDPRFEWDGRASTGRAVPAGVYLAQLVTPDGTFVKRIVFLGSP